MTSEEIREFIRRVINEDLTWSGEYEVGDDTVERIACQWEKELDIQVEAAVKNTVGDKEIW